MSWKLPNLAELESASALIYRHMPPTPQYNWPLLDRLAGTEVWVKHENHTPVGAFKIRGGIVYMDALRSQRTLDGAPHPRRRRSHPRQSRPIHGLRRTHHRR